MLAYRLQPICLRTNAQMPDSRSQPTAPSAAWESFRFRIVGYDLLPEATN